MKASQIENMHKISVVRSCDASFEVVVAFEVPFVPDPGAGGRLVVVGPAGIDDGVNLEEANVAV